MASIRKPPDLTARFQRHAGRRVLGYQARHQDVRDAGVGRGSQRQHDLGNRRVREKLPELTPDRYQALAGPGKEPHHDHHSHPFN